MKRRKLAITAACAASVVLLGLTGFVSAANTSAYDAAKTAALNMLSLKLTNYTLDTTQSVSLGNYKSGQQSHGEYQDTEHSYSVMISVDPSSNGITSEYWNYGEYTYSGSGVKSGDPNIQKMQGHYNYAIDMSSVNNQQMIAFLSALTDALAGGIKTQVQYDGKGNVVLHLTKEQIPQLVQLGIQAIFGSQQQARDASTIQAFDMPGVTVDADPYADLANQFVAGSVVIQGVDVTATIKNNIITHLDGTATVTSTPKSGKAITAKANVSFDITAVGSTKVADPETLGRPIMDESSQVSSVPVDPNTGAALYTDPATGKTYEQDFNTNYYHEVDPKTFAAVPDPATGRVIQYLMDPNTGKLIPVPDATSAQ